MNYEADIKETLMEFVAIDFETANSSRASACQVGVAIFRHNKLVDTWSTYINPQAPFSYWNVKVHGITMDHVSGAPTFSEIYPKLKSLLSNRIVASHTTFDCDVLIQSINEYDLDSISCKWIDTCNIARRAWPQLSNNGYKLNTICNYLNIELKHHEAMSDAIGAGRILVEANKQMNIHASVWLQELQPVTKSPKRAIESIQRNNTTIVSHGIQGNITRRGREDGHLYGKRILFTGNLSISREKAADLASAAGCEVVRSISRTMPLIVVEGRHDRVFLKGKDKSAKIIKAERYRDEGCDITIINEEEFNIILNIRP